MFQSFFFFSSSQGQNKWWWYHGIDYTCFRWPSEEPITDPEVLDNITVALTNSLQRDVESGKFEDWIAKFYDGPFPAVGFTTNASDLDDLDDDETDAEDIDSSENYPPPQRQPGADGILPPPHGHTSPPLRPPPYQYPPQQPDRNIPPYADPSPETLVPKTVLPPPLDPNGWNWQRYTGLGLFLGTMLVTCCLMNVAAYRQKRLREKQLWGNLASEKGVDELLRTGWKIRGSRMEIYDKASLGYGDDGSLFIGGFEQTEMAKELPQAPESETTPDTFHR